MTIELTTLEGQTRTITGTETYKLLFEAVCKYDLRQWKRPTTIILIVWTE